MHANKVAIRSHASECRILLQPCSTTRCSTPEPCMHVNTPCRDAPADMKSKYIHKFEDPREVEIASRVLRVWLDEDTLDPDAMALAERILKAGKTELPNSPYMTILWSSFLIDVQESYISGYGQVQAAKKMSNLSVIERFAVFIRDQEHAQKATAATAGDSENVDLVSYVEFQRNYSKCCAHGAVSAQCICDAIVQTERL